MNKFKEGDKVRFNPTGPKDSSIVYTVKEIIETPFKGMYYRLEEIPLRIHENNLVNAL